MARTLRATVKSLLPGPLRRAARRSISRVIAATRRQRAPTEISRYLGSGGRLLNIGCGCNLLPGWLNTDLEDLPGTVHIDATRRLPLPDSCFDAVFCEHMIEHVPKEAGRAMLREIRRVLAPGGAVRIVTPSLTSMADIVMNPDSEEARLYVSWFTERESAAGARAPFHAADAVNAMFMRHGHVHVYAPKQLVQEMADAGFSEIRTTRGDETAMAVFRGVDGHGAVIGREINRIETFAVEAIA
jgi:SAM-dependent methyltransferase